MESANDRPAPIASTRSGTGEESRIVAGRLEMCFEAAIFDMDGVVTNTAVAHSSAWKEMFDGYLRLRAAARHEPFVEFTRDGDYRAYVDGRPRYNGVETFLNSRGIQLPHGTPDDVPGRDTVCGLGNQKKVIFNRIIEREGIRTFDSTVSMISEMRRRGIKVGLATSSYNSSEVLGRTKISHLFAAVVDGAESAKRGLKGKPNPDIFAAAAGDLGVPSDRAIVVEDAVTGIQAGIKGGFALVVGIAREGNALELQKNGADLVVRDLAETSLEEINRLVLYKRARTR